MPDALFVGMGHRQVEVELLPFGPLVSTGWRPASDFGRTCAGWSPFTFVAGDHINLALLEV